MNVKRHGYHQIDIKCELIAGLTTATFRQEPVLFYAMI